MSEDSADTLAYGPIGLAEAKLCRYFQYTENGQWARNWWLPGPRLTSTCHKTLFIVWTRGTPTKGMVPILAPIKTLIARYQQHLDTQPLTLKPFIFRSHYCHGMSLAML